MPSIAAILATMDLFSENEYSVEIYRKLEDYLSAQEDEKLLAGDALITRGALSDMEQLPQHAT